MVPIWIGSGLNVKKSTVFGCHLICRILSFEIFVQPNILPFVWLSIIEEERDPGEGRQLNV
jgi:hypothetical protein